MKMQIHRVVVRVVFDKPCTGKHAVDAVRDSIHGDFYPDVRRDGDPEKFTVRGVSSIASALKGTLP